MINQIESKLILDYIYDNEAAYPDRIYLTQPTGNGNVVDYTWSQVMDQARRMATCLQSRGVKDGVKVAMLSKNCAHFFMAELAIWMAGGTTVAIFPTETEETVRFVLEQSDAQLLFVGKLDNWEQQIFGVPGNLPCIFLPLAPASSAEQWEHLIQEHQPMPGRPARKPEDLAMINYTSGSTGVQKGAMHCFGRMTIATESIAKSIEASPDDRCISYLPLAHIFERAFIECVSLMVGNHIYFAETLDTFIVDIKRASPTIFLSVPRLWLKFQLGVFTLLPEQRLDFLLRIPLLNRIIGRKVLTGLGLDQVRLAGSGSAPIPPELISWYRRLGLNLLEGYAMTEDFACSHVSTVEFNKIGYVGVPLPGVEVRISDDDEILIKSPGQFIGYYKRPELNAECFTEDGYFRTGDQGTRDSNGLLKLTGRVKELFKTAKGKYVAPAPIENMFNANSVVELSMVSGVGQAAAFGLIQLSEEARKKRNDPVARGNIETELKMLLRHTNAHLAEYERVQMLIIVDEPWSIENGMLTPTMKIKRNRIENAVKDNLDAWYATRQEVIWA